MLSPFTFLAFLSLICGGGSMLLGCGRPLSNAFLIHPSTHVEDAGEARSKVIDTDVGDIEVLIAGARRPNCYVLRLEGNAGRAERTADYVADRWKDFDAEVWAMNFPGFGKSDGPAALDRLTPAAEAIYDGLANKGLPVYLDADSIGTAPALHLAATAHRKPAGIVLKNPPPLKQLILGRYGWWNLWLGALPIAMAVPSELDSLANAEQIQSPVLLFSAENDSLVPMSYQLRIFNRLPGTKRQVVFRDAEHNTPIDPAAERELQAEMTELFKGPSRRQ